MEEIQTMKDMKLGEMSRTRRGSVSKRKLISLKQTEQKYQKLI
jgi:hypothetical protein